MTPPDTYVMQARARATGTDTIDGETVEGTMLRIYGCWAMVGLGFVLNGCASLATHDSELAMIARIMGILSTTSVFVYTVWKLVRLWQRAHKEMTEGGMDE